MENPKNLQASNSHGWSSRSPQWGREKGVGGGEEIKLGFEQTIAGYIKNRALSEVPMEGQNFR